MTTPRRPSGREPSDTIRLESLGSGVVAGRSAPSAVVRVRCSRASRRCTSSASACSSPSSCPSHYKGLGIGVAGLAYTLGLRHAFDADHISAIDNTTRKLMSEGKRPLSIGYWFSLGHSTIVVAIGVGIVVAEKAVYGAVSTATPRSSSSAASSARSSPRRSST